MDFIENIHIKDIAQAYGCQIINEPYATKYYKKTLTSAASCVIIPEQVDIPHNKTLLIHPDPFQVYNAIAKAEGQKHLLKANKISSSANVHASVCIGKNVTIGDNTIIQAQVYIGDNVTIGDNVKIQTGCKIGTDAFYLHKSANKEYQAWHSCGHTIIEDGVHIGANCTINQAVSDITKIGKGTQIDCLVHIAHGVIIGHDCLIAAQVGISGKTIIGNNVSILIIYAQSGVANNLKSDGIYFGSPALPMKEKIKEIKALRRLQK